MFSISYLNGKRKKKATNVGLKMAYSGLITILILLDLNVWQSSLLVFLHKLSYIGILCPIPKFLNLLEY